MVKPDNIQCDPLISVYLPTANRCNLLQRAVTSVLRQSFENFEIIVVDDASEDSTPDYLRDHAQRDARLRWARLTQRSGAPTARNHALSLARGKFITGLDDDDEFLPMRLEGLLDHWREVCSRADAFSCIFTDSYIDNGRKRIPSTDRKDLVQHEDLFTHNFIGNQFFTLTSRLRQLGGFDSAMPAWQDLELLLRMTKMYGPALRAPQRSYVQYADARHDRISAKGENVRGACALISEKYARDDRTKQQLLFIQSFSTFYRRTPAFTDWKLALIWGFKPQVLHALLKSYFVANLSNS